MGDIDVVLLRLTTEPAFCRAVAAGPTRALAPYQLTDEDRELLWLQARTTAPGRWSIPGSAGDRVVTAPSRRSSGATLGGGRTQRLLLGG